ncbi:MAG: DUF1294 domain-containing protein [Lachnospiraceae bacterium]|nr:DUF1294 domain-containing protein [Lachnospiraceae bacterium]
MLKIIILIYVAVNISVFLLYGLDKIKAIKNQWRVPEKTLIVTAVFGVFGAIFGMMIFHHKVRKPKFAIGIPIIMILEIMTFYITWS